MATVRGGDSRTPPAALTTVAAHVLACEVLDAVPPVRVEVTDVERGARCDQTVAAPAPGVIAVPPGAHLGTAKRGRVVRAISGRRASIALLTMPGASSQRCKCAQIAHPCPPKLPTLSFLLLYVKVVE